MWLSSAFAWAQAIHCTAPMVIAENAADPSASRFFFYYQEILSPGSSLASTRIRMRSLQSGFLAPPARVAVPSTGSFEEERQDIPYGFIAKRRDLNTAQESVFLFAFDPRYGRFREQQIGTRLLPGQFSYPLSSYRSAMRSRDPLAAHFPQDFRVPVVGHYVAEVGGARFRVPKIHEGEFRYCRADPFEPNSCYQGDFASFRVNDPSLRSFELRSYPKVTFFENRVGFFWTGSIPNQTSAGMRPTVFLSSVDANGQVSTQRIFDDGVFRLVEDHSEEFLSLRVPGADAVLRLATFSPAAVEFGVVYRQGLESDERTLMIPRSFGALPIAQRSVYLLAASRIPDEQAGQPGGSGQEPRIVVGSVGQPAMFLKQNLTTEIRLPGHKVMDPFVVQLENRGLLGSQILFTAVEKTGRASRAMSSFCHVK